MPGRILEHRGTSFRADAAADRQRLRLLTRWVATLQNVEFQGGVRAFVCEADVRRPLQDHGR